MKALVDTSIWIEHFRKSNKELVALLRSRKVLSHSAIIGELACGGILKRKEIIRDLLLLPRATEASFDESLQYIETHKLSSKGLGWVDVQILASAALSGAIVLSLDKNLMKVFK